MKRIEDNLFKKNIDLIKPWMKADKTSEYVIRKISDEIKADYDEVMKKFNLGCEQMAFVSPDVPKLIRKLQKDRIEVYFASNKMDSFDRWTVSYMKLHNLFDIVKSLSLKALKHVFNEDRSIFFDSVFWREGVLPQDTVLNDDSEDKQNLLTNNGIHYRRISDSHSLIDELNLFL